MDIEANFATVIDNGSTSLSKSALKKILKKEQWLHTKEEKKVERKERLRLRKEVEPTGYSMADMQQTTYYFEQGFRKVRPYVHLYKTYVKARWFGRTLQDVMQSEFHANSFFSAVDHISLGFWQVNKQAVSGDYILRDGDLIEHYMHCHEVPVLDKKIEILHEDDELLVMNKPASLPIHPCGRYRYNSLLFILGKEWNIFNVRTLYRLDRLTSGVLIMAKSLNKASSMMRQIRDRSVNKFYIANVIGHFPPEVVKCSEALGCLDEKIGLQAVNTPNGKACETYFHLISYNDTLDSSLVLCAPRTGRTHQIRVHLQFLGHPITNDIMYNQESVWGRELGKEGRYHKDLKQLIDSCREHHSSSLWVRNSAHDGMATSIKKRKIEDLGDINNDCGNESISYELIKSEKVENTVSAEENRSICFTDSNALCNTAGKKLFHGESGMIQTDGVSLVQSYPVSSTVTDNVGDENPSTFSDSSVSASTNDSIGTSAVDIPCIYPNVDEHLLTKHCYQCQKSYIDPIKDSLEIYLHAFRYKFESQTFTAPLPEWASPYLDTCALADLIDKLQRHFPDH